MVYRFGENPGSCMVVLRIFAISRSWQYFHFISLTFISLNNNFLPVVIFQDSIVSELFFGQNIIIIIIITVLPFRH